jgi:hypothetical protein
MERGRLKPWQYLSEGGQVRTVSAVDVEVGLGPRSLENKPLLLQPDLALPGKRPGPYTGLIAAFEMVSKPSLPIHSKS